MSHLRKYLVGLTALLVVNTLAMARQHYSTSRPIQQNMPHGCSHIYDCPDYLSAAYWSTYQNRCCLVKNGSKYHCQQNFVEAHGGHTDIQVVCVYPKTCAAGYYAYLKTWIEDGITYGVVECLPCNHDRYQPYPEQSFMFRWANCTNVWQTCLREYGLILVTKGNTTHDNQCRCWWEGGYGPDSAKDECRSLNGFNQDDCQCRSYTCLDGQALNEEFICVPQTKTTPTTHHVHTTGPTTRASSPVKGASSINIGDSIHLFVTFATLTLFTCIGVAD